MRRRLIDAAMIAAIVGWLALATMGCAHSQAAAPSTLPVAQARIDDIERNAVNAMAVLCGVAASKLDVPMESARREIVDLPVPVEPLPAVERAVTAIFVRALLQGATLGRAALDEAEKKIAALEAQVSAANARVAAAESRQDLVMRRLLAGSFGAAAAVLAVLVLTRSLGGNTALSIGLIVAGTLAAGGIGTFLGWVVSGVILAAGAVIRWGVYILGGLCVLGAGYWIVRTALARAPKGGEI